jgi:hypothetical protein
VKKEEEVVVTMNEASWIDAKVEVVKHYLTKEFENFTITHRADHSHTHTFTVDDGKKRFTLLIGVAILAHRRFTPARIDRLLKNNVAEGMRLHGEAGYHWTPSQKDTTQRGGM